MEIEKGQIRQEGSRIETHAFFTSSSLRGPEALRPRAVLSEASSDFGLSSSDVYSYSSSLWCLLFEEVL